METSDLDQWETIVITAGAPGGLTALLKETVT